MSFPDEEDHDSLLALQGDTILLTMMFLEVKKRFISKKERLQSALPKKLLNVKNALNENEKTDSPRHF